ncbi:hypothetical protein ALI144C_17745 [Actinosynnema sp. ALI-1.44]|nr:hypothetical protein ALI144C_17745 [Actinosynnema sp. ALI-1.44]
MPFRAPRISEQELDRRLTGVRDMIWAEPNPHEDPDYRRAFVQKLARRAGWASPFDDADTADPGPGRVSTPAGLEVVVARWEVALADRSYLPSDPTAELARLVQNLSLHVLSPGLATVSPGEIGSRLAQEFMVTTPSFGASVRLLGDFLSTLATGDRWLGVIAEFSEGYAAGVRNRALQEQTTMLTALDNAWAERQFDALRDARHFREIFRESPVAMGVLDSGGRITHSNRSLQELLGRAGDHLRGLELATFAHTAQDRDVIRSLYRRPGQPPAGTGPRQVQLTAFTGRRIWVSLCVDDRSPEHDIHVVMVNAIDSMQIRRWLDHRAERDDVTELPDQRSFLRRLKDLLADRRAALGVGVYAIRLDGLSAITKRLGAAAGARAGRILAARAQSGADSAELVAQLDDHTLGFLIADPAGWASAGDMIKRLVALLGGPLQVGNDKPVAVTPVVGAAQTRSRDTDPAVLLRWVYQSLDAATVDTSDAVAFHDPESVEWRWERDRNLALTRLPRALETGEVWFTHAPIASAETGEIVGAHATPDWRRPQQWPVPLSDVLRLATDMDWSMRISVWMIRQAAGQIAEWYRLFGDQAPFLRIDLPKGLVLNDALAEHLSDALRAHSFPTKLLQLGFHESSLVRAGRRCQQVVTIASTGVGLVLNGFGVDVRHINLVPQLYLGGMVIPPELAPELTTHPIRSATSVIKSLIELAHKLEAEVTVQAVDSTAQEGKAREFGCRHIEGDVVGKPERAVDFATRYLDVPHDIQTA